MTEEESNVFSLRREKAIAQVRKILALAKGNGSQEEAATAVAMAQKIMDEFHISEAEAAAKDPTIKQEDVGREPLDEAAATEFWNEWERDLAHVIAKSFHCESYHSSRTPYTVWLVGTLSDRQTVAYLFRYLQAELQRLGDVGYDMQGARDVEDVFDFDAPRPVVDRTKKSQWLKDFYRGATLTLRDRLATERKALAAAPQYGLMVATRDQAVVKFMKEKVGKLGRGRRSSGGGSNTGMAAGRAAGQVVPLGNPGAKRLN